MTASDPLVATLDALPGADLDDLASRASLMSRTDRKYLVPAASLPELVRRFVSLDAGLRVLDIDGQRRHRYSSTYLDTPTLDSYWLSARRRRHRFKVRLREYVDTGLCFTEVKIRGARGRTVKTRVPIHGAGVVAGSAGRLSGLQHQFVAAELARAGFPLVDVRSLAPTLRTTYRRATLWLPARQTRVTLDTDLTWSAPTGDPVTHLDGLAVVETKTAAGGTGADRVLWRQGHRPARISKYGTGLSLLLADLPAHRWHRVRTRIQPCLLQGTSI